MENLSVKVNNLFNDKEIILNKEDIVKIVQDAILKGVITISLKPKYEDVSDSTIRILDEETNILTIDFEDVEATVIIK